MEPSSFPLLAVSCLDQKEKKRGGEGLGKKGKPWFHGLGKGSYLGAPAAAEAEEPLIIHKEAPTNAVTTPKPTTAPASVPASSSTNEPSWTVGLKEGAKVGL